VPEKNGKERSFSAKNWVKYRQMTKLLYHFYKAILF